MADVVKTLKVSTSGTPTNYELEDERINTGTSLPTSGNVADDIYLKFNDSGVETGNGWRYITSPEGVTHCWKTFDLGSVTQNTGWGVGRIVKNPIPAADLVYPVTFSVEPAVLKYVECTTNNGWLVATDLDGDGSGGTGPGTKTCAPNCYWASDRPSNATSTNVKIFYHVIGVV